MELGEEATAEVVMVGWTDDLGYSFREEGKKGGKDLRDGESCSAFKAFYRQPER